MGRVYVRRMRFVEPEYGVNRRIIPDGPIIQPQGRCEVRSELLPSLPSTSAHISGYSTEYVHNHQSIACLSVCQMARAPRTE